MLPDIISAASFWKGCCLPCIGLNASCRRPLGSGGQCVSGSQKEPFQSSQQSYWWQRFTQTALPGPWKLESQNPKVIIPLSRAHIWNALFLSGRKVIGHLMTFQLCRGLQKKKVSIIIYLYLQYHLSTFCLKCISTCILDFTLLVKFFMILLTENSTIFWKLLWASHGDLLGIEQFKLKFHYLQRHFNYL